MLALWLSILGCSSPIDCSDPASVVVEANGHTLTCQVAAYPVEWIALLAGRPVPRADRRLVLEAVRDRYRSDTAGTRAWLTELAAAGAQLERGRGLEGAEARGTAVWRAQDGTGRITDTDGVLWTVQERSLAVWAHDDTDKLALAEADVEGWIRYASLCREAQGGTGLRISVSDRVGVYTMLQERFRSGTRADRVGLVAMGPFWDQVAGRWKAASFSTQQTWIQEAPLPPPMTATSLGYGEAVFNGPVGQHAAVLHETLGPFQLAGNAPAFPESRPTP